MRRLFESSTRRASKRSSGKGDEPDGDHQANDHLPEPVASKSASHREQNERSSNADIPPSEHSGGAVLSVHGKRTVLHNSIIFDS
jgi:hypothetical protein